MPEQKRTAPHPEWIQMYRQGLTTTKIAAMTGAAQSTVRYPGSGTTTATQPGPNRPRGSLRGVQYTIALFKAEGRLPSSKSPSAQERALATWLLRQRQTTTRARSPPPSDGLQEIPGW